jgi:hypothetical protein
MQNCTAQSIWRNHKHDRAQENANEKREWRRPFNRIFSKICELLGSYQEYPAKSVGKQGEEFLIAALVKSNQDSLLGIY